MIESASRSFTSCLGCLALLGVATTVGCGRDAPESPAQYENIIVATPFSGSFAVKAEEHKNAILMAIERFEQAGGRPNRPIRLVFSDTSGADAMAATAALEATFAGLTVDGVTHAAAMITSSTSAQLPAIPFALRYAIPHIEVSSGSGFDEADATSRATLAMTGVQDRFFATRPLCLPEPDFSAEFVAAQATAGQGWSRIAIIQNGSGHDLMHANYFRTGMVNRVTGFTPVVDIDLKTSMKTYEQAINEAISANADVIYFHINGDQNNINFFKAARDAEYAGKLVTCGMARIQEVLRVGDPDVAPYLAENRRLYFQVRGPLPSPELRQFQDDLRAYTEKGGEIDNFSASAYDAAMLMALGLQYAQATGLELAPAMLAVATGEGTNQRVVPSNRIDAEVIDRLAAGEDINYEGTASKLEFSRDHPAAPNGHDHFGYQTRGSYYVEQIVRVAPAAYAYEALPSPYVEL